MSKRKRRSPRVGRSAIDLLVNAMEMGFNEDTPGTIEFLASQGIARKYLKWDAVCNWKRQAALAVQANGSVSVTNPVYANVYHSNSAPTAIQRREGRHVRRKDTFTRVKNDGIEASADANRIDATAAERAIPDLYDSVRSVLAAISTLSQDE